MSTKLTGIVNLKSLALAARDFAARVSSDVADAVSECIEEIDSVKADKSDLDEINSRLDKFSSEKYVSAYISEEDGNLYFVRTESADELNMQINDNGELVLIIE